MKAVTQAAIRLVVLFMGLQLFMGLLRSIVNLIVFRDPYYEQYGYYLAIGLSAAMFVLEGFVLYVVWRKAERLARTILGDNEDGQLVIATSARDLVGVALGVMGIYLVATTIGRIFGLVAFRFRSIVLAGEGATPTLQPREAQDWVVAVVTLLLGAFLMWGGRGTVNVISDIWNRGSVRQGGAEKERDQNGG